MSLVRVSAARAGPAAILAQLEQCIRGMTDMYGAVNALLNQLDLASDHTEDHSYPANESEGTRYARKLDESSNDHVVFSFTVIIYFFIIFKNLFCTFVY